MSLNRLLFAASAVAVLSSLSMPAAAQNNAVPVIFKGKVQLPDGSSMGKSIGIERVCSDVQGSAPGPLTNKDGAFVWRMDIDFMRTRTCYLQATLNGYTSSQIDISNVNPSVSINVDLVPIVITQVGADPYQLGGAEKDVPSKALKAWNASMKAISAQNLPEAIVQMKIAVEGSPKFTLGWQNLGVLYEAQNDLPNAHDAYQKAIAADPKNLSPYVTLARVSVKQKDWATVATAVTGGMPLDKKHLFPELYVHQAAAQYNMKDYAGAEASANTALQQKPMYPRAEYVLGRILEAKGDTAGAKQHMAKYLEIARTAPDAAQIKAHMDGIGQVGNTEPELDPITR